MSFRVLLTEKCNARCKNCFNASIRNKCEMKTKQFEKLCMYLSENGEKSIKIMGGEPTVHTQFTKCYSIAQHYFESVVLFTNALNGEVTQISPRDNDYITYNFKFIDENFNLDKLMLDKKGYRSIELQIGTDTDIELYIKRINILSHYIDHYDNISFNLTLDCTEHIFEHKELLQKKWWIIKNYLEKVKGIKVFLDHKIPKCFWDGKGDDAVCVHTCGGLIDTSLNLIYCNQYQKKIITLQVAGKWVSMNEVQESLQRINAEKNEIETCKSCKFYKDKKCNGGCFGHKMTDSLVPYDCNNC